MRTIITALIAFLAAGVAHAAEPYTLAEGTWVCQSEQAYDDAIAEVKKRQGKNLGELQRRLKEQGYCTYMDDDALEDLMAPFVQVLEENGDKVKVTFIVEYYKRIAMLHRRFARIQYTGWTERTNLRDYYR